MQQAFALILSRVVTRILLPCLFVTIAALLPGDASATTFTPTWSADLGISDSGAHSTLTFNLHIPAPDSQLGTAVSFIPPEFGVTNGDSLTNGAITGRVAASATLGLVGGACGTTLDLTFDLMDASTDPLNTIYLYDGVYDYDGDGKPENVDRYPSSLAFVAPDIVPVQRLYGQVLVSSVLVPINFAIFEPGTPLPLLPALDPSMGYPTVAIIGDPLAVPGATFPISDFCTPLTSTIVIRGTSLDNPALAGNEEGQAIVTNPAGPGQYNVILFARGRFDADNDGIENGLDICPLTPDPTWDPRSGGAAGDADMDGLPSSCDPNDSLHDADNDGDAFNNRLDLCPLVATAYLHYDSDRDGIGDGCDPLPADESNGGAAHRHELCLSDAVTIGSPGPGAPPPWPCPSGPDLPIPPRLIVSPSDGLEAVGFVHSVRAVTLKPAGTGYAVGVTVNFQVTGANPQTGSCLTSNSGDCEFNYLGANAGEDTIETTATIVGVSLSRTVSNLSLGPPLNDDFANAAAAASLPFSDVQLPIAAGIETGEGAACADEVSHSVWYSFTPSQDVLITALVETSSSYMVLAAYTGTSLDAVTVVRCDADPVFVAGGAGGPSSYYYRNSMSFWADAGVTYRFQAASQVGGFYGYPEVEFSLQETILGDADCSGVLNAVDALGVLRKSAGLSAAACVGAADVNCSGGLNSVDALLILRAAAGIIPKPTSCP